MGRDPIWFWAARWNGARVGKWVGIEPIGGTQAQFSLIGPFLMGRALHTILDLKPRKWEWTLVETGLVLKGYFTLKLQKANPQH